MSPIKISPGLSLQVVSYVFFGTCKRSWEVMSWNEANTTIFSWCVGQTSEIPPHMKPCLLFPITANIIIHHIVYIHDIVIPSSYPAGSVVLILLNLNTYDTNATLANTELASSSRDVYWLTPPGNSTNVLSK